MGTQQYIANLEFKIDVSDFLKINELLWDNKFPTFKTPVTILLRGDFELAGFSHLTKDVGTYG